MGWKLRKIGNTFINSSKNCTEPKIPYNLPWSGGQILPGYYNSFWSLRNFFSLRFYTKASYSLENIKNSLSVLQENRNKNYDFERQKNVKWSSSNHLALSPLELNESGFMSRYWHFLITHSLKLQDERSTHGECSKSSQTRRTEHSRLARGFRVALVSVKLQKKVSIISSKNLNFESIG